MVVGLICFFAILVAFATNNFVVWACVLVGSVILSLIPLEGYIKPEEEEIKLIKIKKGDYEQGYIRTKGRKATYAYDNRKEYNLKGEAYEEGRIRGNIKIYESEDCKEPILKIIKEYPERGLIAIALFATKTKYVFFVPMNSVNVTAKKGKTINILR